MITKNNFVQVLQKLDFYESDDVFTKKFIELNCELKVDFKNEKLIYPENQGFIVNERQTCNFKAPENFVVFECIHRLFTQKYRPENIELEPKWQVGHGASGGRADILIRDNQGKSLLIIECKTAGIEFSKAWNETQTKPTQIFSYVQQEKSTKFMALYASDFVDSQVEARYFLLNIQDNEKLLENNKKLLSYKEATTTEEIYKVWLETYQKDYATQGLFEDNKPYEIGKTKFKISDLKNVNSKDIQGKYHEFATVLRQHNVSGRENAFDKLVNLFLCKVTDEKDHPQELQFYWKGIAYDNPFDFQDRLQKLYKKGMEKFIGETITYIDDNLVDEAFAVFKNKPNATKDKIKQFLKEQKFFTNNDFAFIDVHNEKLFYQNFDVLLKIARMIQDISLTGSDENQFLGDMFEGFLDQGVKQSEGQFFTPMPIVKFIINSLPEKEKPNVIDYACGAGHFLNEYASKIKESQIIGIEKEYRLSKVAKVSSFMYGNEIKIIYEDALKENQKTKNNDFDVLIANPPYSVKGFLETLSEEERAKFELTKEIDKKSYTKNNAIECFFIERAKQLLRKDAVAGIILPSSILSKGGIYTKTREIILKYFEVVAVAEFGSGTFGKTGTNTVTLFLKRRGQTPDLAEHLQNMVNTWFEWDLETNKNFIDDDLLQKYCQHRAIDFEIYKTLLRGDIDERLFENETFKDYQNAFENLTETKNRRSKAIHKNLSKEEKEKEDKKALLAYIREIEKDKLLYFALAYKNEQEVVIVKSPSGNNEMKKFLGYDWSSAKGNEGIKYLASQVEKVEDEDLEEEDKRVLENLTGLKYINTPLYNPQNLDDENKINTIIKKNFESSEPVEVPENLSEFVSKARLVDMLDFERVDFDKAFSLSPKIFTPIKSKYQQAKLTDVFLEVKNGKNVSQNDEKGKFKVSRIETIATGFFDSNAIKWTNDDISEHDFLQKGDILFSHINSLEHLGKTAIFNLDEKIVHGVNLLRFRANKNYILPNFAIEILKLDDFRNEIRSQAKKAINQSSVNITYLSEQKIPLPPLDIQEKIVAECEKVDSEVAKANEEIEEAKREIEREINAVSGEMVKIGDISEVIAGQSPSSDFYNERKQGLPFYQGKKDYGDVYLEEPKVWTTQITKESLRNDLLMSVRAPVGNVNINPFDKICIGRGLAVIRTKNIETQKYLFEYISHNQDLFKGNKGTTFDAISTADLRQIKIPLPPLEIQKQIVAKIEKMEEKINEAKKIVEGAKGKKEEVLKKWL